MTDISKTHTSVEGEESVAEVIRQLKAKKAEIKNRPAEPGKKLVIKKRKPKTNQFGVARNRRKTAA